MRIGNWKIIADKDLQKFQLYQIKTDWKEVHDLAEKHPDKLAELKAIFLEVWAGVETEGPSEWWKNQAEKSREKQSGRKKSDKLPEGKDATGDFAIVRGTQVTKSDFGCLLDTCATSASTPKTTGPSSPKASVSSSSAYGPSGAVFFSKFVRNRR